MSEWFNSINDLQSPPLLCLYLLSDKLRLSLYHVAFLLQVYLHDTGGGERFRTLTSNFYRNASAAILMYSVDEMLSFQNLQEWIENLHSSMIPWDPDNFAWAIIGNKCDLPLEIEHGTILSLCKQQNTTMNFFTSAKTGENVKAAFEKIVEDVHRKLSHTRTPQSTANHGNIKIGGKGSTKSTTSDKKCC